MMITHRWRVQLFLDICLAPASWRKLSTHSQHIPQQHLPLLSMDEGQNRYQKTYLLSLIVPDTWHASGPYLLPILYQHHVNILLHILPPYRSVGVRLEWCISIIRSVCCGGNKHKHTELCEFEMERQTGHSRRLAHRIPEAVTNHCCCHPPSCTAPAHRVTVRWEGSGHLRHFKLPSPCHSPSPSLLPSVLVWFFFHKVEFILLFFSQGSFFLSH